MSIDVTPLLTVSRLRVAGAEGQLVGPVSFEMHAGREIGRAHV